MRRELAGIALLLLALFLGAAIAFPGADAASCVAERGPTGPVGACLRSMFVATLGLPATVLLPLMPLVYALRVFRRIEADTDRSWLVFLGGLTLLLPVAIALAMGSSGSCWSWMLVQGCIREGLGLGAARAKPAPVTARRPRTGPARRVPPRR